MILVNSKGKAMDVDFPKVENFDLGCLTPIEMNYWVEKANKAEVSKDYEDFANSLFFDGGSLIRKKEVPDNIYESGVRYLKKWMSSFDPPHEKKALVCGFILSLLSELPGEKNEGN